MYFSNLNLSCISFAFYAVCIEKSGVSASEKDFRLNMFIWAYTIVLLRSFTPLCPWLYMLDQNLSQWERSFWQKRHLKTGMKLNATCTQCSLLGYQAKYIPFKEIAAQGIPSSELPDVGWYAAIPWIRLWTKLFSSNTAFNSMFCIKKNLRSCRWFLS